MYLLAISALAGVLFEISFLLHPAIFLICSGLLFIMTAGLLRAGMPSLVLMAFLFGGFSMSLEIPEYDPENFIKKVSFSNVKLEFKISELFSHDKKQDSPGKERIVSGAGKVIAIWKDGQRERVRGRILFSLPENFEGLTGRGCRIIASGRLFPLTVTVNFFTKSFGQSEIEKGTRFNFRIESAQNVDSVVADSFFYLRNRMEKAIELGAPPESAGILKALLTGERQDVSEETNGLMRASGLFHILSISGLHVSLLLTGTRRLLSFLCCSSLIGSGAGLLIVWSYVVITGLVPCSFRAAFIGTFGIISEESGLLKNNWSSLSLAALINILFDPQSSMTPGFWLSYMAYAGIILFTEPFTVLYNRCIHTFFEIIAYCKLRKPPSFISAAFIQTVSAQLGVIGILPCLGFPVPLVSIPANILAVPVVDIAMMLLVTGGAISLLSLSLGRPFLYLAGLAIYIVEYIAFLASHIKITLVSGIPSFWSVFCYCTVFFLLILFDDMFQERTGKKYLYCCFFFSLMWLVLDANIPEKGGRIYFFDTGQGDMALVISERKKTVLIDGGPAGRKNGERILFPVLRRHGIKKLDLVLLSHFHDDHYGAVVEMLESNEFSVGEFIVSGAGPVPEKLKRSIEKYHGRGGKVIFLDGLLGRRLDELEILLAGESSGDTGSDNNEVSMKVKMKIKNLKILFTGDSPAHILEDTGKNFLACNIMKVPHHGAAIKKNSRLYLESRPGISIISCSERNRFGHPSPVTVQKIFEAGSLPFITAEHGAIVFFWKNASLKYESADGIIRGELILRDR